MIAISSRYETRRYNLQEVLRIAFSLSGGANENEQVEKENTILGIQFSSQRETG